MNKEHLKWVFLSISVAIAIRSLIMGWDVASGLALLVTSCVLFAYDFISHTGQMDKVEKALKQLEHNQNELHKDMQQMKSARNIQKVNMMPTSGLNNNGFPPRFGG